ncbi:hypothetical protein KQI86_19905 [Clostridium sp. MSJ-11]|uniref:Uncharacterized protein n=1 Tax=Clostridium mobile TaxID=2841512 RepID=A0ABS6EN49_9CLOT|nr:hypothetical protein [Clostridium mobile]MBU5486552.1 hypothetical protein [Clostridium mobile]
MKKNIGILLLALSLTASIPTAAYAANPTNEKTQNYAAPIEEKEDSLRSIRSELAKSGATLTLISEDEYYAEKAKLTNESIETVKNRDKLRDSLSLRASDPYTYGTISRTETLVDGKGAKCQIRYGFKAKFYSSGSFHEYKEILDKGFVIASGSGDFDWEPAGDIYMQIINNGWNVRFMASGVVKATVDSTLSAGFEAAGFSLGGTSGTSRVYRNYYDIHHNF